MIKIDGFEIDASLTEEHATEAEVTEFPVESGGTISDHVRIKQRTYRMRGIVTNTPIGKIADLRIDPNRTPVEVARDVLESIFTAKEPVVIETALRTYKAMLMESLAIELTGETGDALPFTAAFRELTIVTNKRVSVRVKVPLKADRGTLGKKPPGWVATDKLGRDIIVIEGTASYGNTGTVDRYVRQDGVAVSDEEAAAAVRSQDAVLVRYDKNGKHVPVSDKDYQPYTPKKRKPFWAPLTPVKRTR